MAGEKIEVENVNHPGKTYRVDAANYHIARAAMLRILPASAPGLTQAEMLDAMRAALRPAHPEMKAGWWMKSVQLDLEAKGLVVRDGGKPLRWTRT
jgi:hypothetical protein